MFLQDKIKQYHEYGFTIEEIAEELSISPSLVRSALKAPETTSTDHPFITKQFNRWKYGHYGTTRVIPSLELLWKVGPHKMNEMLEKWGQALTAEHLGVSRNLIIAVRYYFGYHEKIPPNAWNYLSYVPLEIRKQVDERDQRICVRCNRKIVTDSEVRYHKIYWRGPMSADNVATVCRLCRRERLVHLVADNPEMFRDMRFEDFKKWIQENDPAWKHQLKKDMI